MARANGSPIFLLEGKGRKARRIKFPLLIDEKDSRDSGNDEGGYALPPDSPEQCESLSLEKEE